LLMLDCVWSPSTASTWSVYWPPEVVVLPAVFPLIIAVSVSPSGAGLPLSVIFPVISIGLIGT